MNSMSSSSPTIIIQLLLSWVHSSCQLSHHRFTVIPQLSQQSMLYLCIMISPSLSVDYPGKILIGWYGTNHGGRINTVDGCGILHQLIDDGKRPMILLGFQPSFWWRRISQPSTVPFGKKSLHSYGLHHHFSWVNQLFLWSFSIAEAISINLPVLSPY